MLLKGLNHVAVITNDATRLNDFYREVYAATGGIPDPAMLDDLAPLGVCPLRLTGTDTDMLYAGAAARAERFLR